MRKHPLKGKVCKVDSHFRISQLKAVAHQITSIFKRRNLTQVKGLNLIRISTKKGKREQIKNKLWN